VYEDFLKGTLKNGEYVTDTIYSQKKFFVLLTNQRIIVIKKNMTGFFKDKVKSVEILHNIPLESIMSVETIQSLLLNFRADLAISTAERKMLLQSLLNPSIPKESKYALILKEEVLKLIKERREELERKKPSVIIDFSFLKTFIEKGGIVLTTLKCPHCSAPIKMPKDGTETVCEHCGSTVYAQDVFEKVKKLIE